MPFYRVLRNKSLTQISSFYLCFLLAGGSLWASKGLKNRLPGLHKVYIQNHGKVDSAPFFRLNPFLVTILNAQGKRVLFRVSMMLETHSYETKQKLQRLLPKIYSAVLEDFYGLIYLAYQTSVPLNLMILKSRAEKAVSKIAGPDLVRDLLLDKAYIVPMAER